MSATRPITVFENARVVTHDGVSTQNFALVDGRIGNVAAGEFAFRVDLRDHLVFPGLVNAHDHLQLNCIPRLPHDRPFGNSYEWIEAFESFRKKQDVAAWIAVPEELRHWQGALKNILSGVTTVAHHDPWRSLFAHHDFPVDVVRDIGWAHSLGLGDPQDGYPPKYGPPVHDSFMDTPPSHAWVIHAAEGIDAAACGELDRLDQLGCLAENTVIVHGVGLTKANIEHVIERGASVVWCPSSNLELFGRTLEPRRLWSMHRLALGTDSRLTGSRDLLDELRFAARHCDLSAAELLRLVTVAAADVLRIGRGAGRLERNGPADCLILRDHAHPHHALLEASRADIRAVVRRGAPVVADPDFAEWFAYCGIATASVTLDGRPKLLARYLAMRDLAALEPGLEIS